CTGNVLRNPAGAMPLTWPLLPGFRSNHAAAILGRPDRNAGTFANGDASPPPKVIDPFEFSQNPFHTPLLAGLHVAPTWNTSPSGFPNSNSNPPDSGPFSIPLPAPSSSSPPNGDTWSSPPATWWHRSNNSKITGPLVTSSP